MIDYENCLPDVIGFQDQSGRIYTREEAEGTYGAKLFYWLPNLEMHGFQAYGLKPIREGDRL